MASGQKIGWEACVGETILTSNMKKFREEIPKKIKRKTKKETASGQKIGWEARRGENNF